MGGVPFRARNCYTSNEGDVVFIQVRFVYLYIKRKDTCSDLPFLSRKFDKLQTPRSELSHVAVPINFGRIYVNTIVNFQDSRVDTKRCPNVVPSTPN